MTGDGNYTLFILTDGTQHLSSKTLSLYEACLPPEFLRIHKRAILLIATFGIHPCTNNSMQVGWISEWQRDGKTVSGLLLFHVHNQWGLADAAVLSSLASGADGVWASVAEEGAAQGAPSALRPPVVFFSN